MTHQVSLTPARRFGIFGKAASIAVIAVAGFAIPTNKADAQIASGTNPYLGPSVFSPQPVMTWSGFYIGINAGAGFGGDYKASTSLFGTPIQSTLSAGGFTGGMQAGYNFQIEGGQGFVVGVEGDFNYANFKNSSSIGVPGFGSASVEAKTDYFATFRARFGYAFDNVMLYGTGGIAFTHAKLSASESTGLFLPNSISNSQSHTGWVIGAGMEAALNANVSLRAEYLYADFGRKTYFSQFASPAFPGIRVKLDQHIIRTGLNYRF